MTTGNSFLARRTAAGRPPMPPPTLSYIQEDNDPTKNPVFEGTIQETKPSHPLHCRRGAIDIKALHKAQAAELTRQIAEEIFPKLSDYASVQTQTQSRLSQITKLPLKDKLRELQTLYNHLQKYLLSLQETEEIDKELSPSIRELATQLLPQCAPSPKV